MKSLLDKMVVDQIEYMNNKIELEKLEKEKERLVLQVNTMAKEKADLIKKNNEISTKLSKLNNNIIQYKNK